MECFLNKGINKDEVKEAIAVLKGRKASGFNELPNEMTNFWALSPLGPAPPQPLARPLAPSPSASASRRWTSPPHPLLRSRCPPSLEEGWGSAPGGSSCSLAGHPLPFSSWPPAGTPGLKAPSTEFTYSLHYAMGISICLSIRLLFPHWGPGTPKDPSEGLSGVLVTCLIVKKQCYFTDLVLGHWDKA